MPKQPKAITIYEKSIYSFINFFLFIKSIVVITDELIYTFDQGELCRHPVTVPGANLIIYHTGDWKSESGGIVTFG
jgi:hypothetical protein